MILRGKVYPFMMLALCLAPMLLFAYRGFFSRPMSDDFCHLAITPQLSIWDNLLHWRNGASNGSFANLAMNSLLTPFGMAVTSAFPALLISLWFASTAALLSTLMARLGLMRHRLLIALALAALLVAAISDSLTTPAALYWYTASMKYMAPMLVLALYLLLLLHVARQPQAQSVSWLTTFAAAALCFFAAGFAETLTMPLLLGLTLLIGALLVSRGPLRRCLPLLGAGWIATVASIVVMITAPGVSRRTEMTTSSLIVINRDAGDVLSLAADAWLDHITDPAALASFIFMLAAGLLAALLAARPATAPASALGRITVNPWRFGLAVQLLLLPTLWSHLSDSPSVLGRYSTSYFVVIACNAALIIGMALLLRQHRRGHGILARHFYILPCVLLAVILLLFALTQIRIIHWRANTFLWASVHSLLAVLVWQLSSHLPRGVARRFAVGIGCLYITSWLGTAAVVLAVNTCCKEDILRTYTFLAHIVAWQGLAWGLALGLALKNSAQTNRLLKIGALLVALWLGGTIVGDNLALVPKFQQYAHEFDMRHAYILKQRQTGQQKFTFAQLSFDLPRYLGVAPLDTHPCPLYYYGIELIDIVAR